MGFPPRRVIRNNGGANGSSFLGSGAHIGDSSSGKKRSAARRCRCWAYGTLFLAGLVLCSQYVRSARCTGFLGAGTEVGSGAGADAPVVAFAISLTSLAEGPSSMLDAAEVLLGSIRRACGVSSYRCETVAFVLPSVPEAGKRLVRDMGWKVMEKDLPVLVEDIRNKAYAKFVVNSGCCGANEFIKLHSYTLTQYHRVVHLDVDTLLMHPIDELMDSEASLVYTTDPAMAMAGQRVAPIQGGFLLVNPDMAVYEALCEVVREGNWRQGFGWGESGIGWFYGGATVQGLLPYFYNVLAPGTALEVDRCVYNNMCDCEKCRSAKYTVTTTLQKPKPSGSKRVVTIDENLRGEGAMERGGINSSSGEDAASSVPIKSVHFTQQCPKPWLCAGSGRHKESACADLQRRWSEGRRAVFAAKGLPFKDMCSDGHYVTIPR